MSSSARQTRLHPYYSDNYTTYYKYRLTYEGGDPFKIMYLQRYSVKESETDFLQRRSITPVPSFAKSSIKEIVNTLGQRMKDISRIGGSNTYVNAVENDIDGRQHSMAQYCTQYIIPELLVMAKVGVYIDSTAIGTAKPYIYYYRWEDIKNWKYDTNGDFESVILLDREYVYDEDGFPYNIEEVERYIYKLDGKIYVKIKDVTTELDIKTFPFVVLEMNQSLLVDIADYQIALMNLMSGDMSYCMFSNIPFYVEPYNPMAEAANNIIGTQEKTDKSKIEIGTLRGRRYPEAGNAPEFIHPSTEPLQASMNKQAQLKEEMRQLLSLSISNLRSTWASADSKAADKEVESNGLAEIGRELERFERHVAQVWHEYEGVENNVQVIYPKDYTLQSTSAAIEEAERLNKMMHVVPSITYQQNIGLRVARKLLTGHVSATVLEQVEKEITASPCMNSDPTVITMDLKNGLVGNDLASRLRGYPDGEVDKAEVDHAEKLFRISMYQSAGSLRDPTNPQGRPQSADIGKPDSDS